MPINNRQELVEYSLRQLGGGIVNIEVTPEQLEDIVESALQYFNEYHYDGITKDYYSRKITASTFVASSVVGLSAGDLLTFQNGASGNIRKLVGTTVHMERNTSGIPYANGTVTNGTVTVTASSTVIGDVDNKYIYCDDSIIGVTKILNLSHVMSSGDFMWNPQYQVMMQEIHQLTSSGGVNYYYSVMSYMEHLNFILRKNKDFRFNRRMNRLYLDINWNSDLKIDDIVVAEIYRALDDDTYSFMLNDVWLKRYTTALLKKQWGTNLKKYNGMQLPGGLTYNGQIIYDEAVLEIKELEEEARNFSAPLEMFVG